MAPVTLNLNIRSDYYCQIKPSKLPELKTLVENGSKHSPCYFTTKHLNLYLTPQEVHISNQNPKFVWAVDRLKFTNFEVYTLLSKSIKIVENTEEYLTYLLSETFEAQTKKYTFTPPGTLRIFDQELICFYTGKNWREISL